MSNTYIHRKADVLCAAQRAGFSALDAAIVSRPALVRRKEPPNNIHSNIARDVIGVNVKRQRDDGVDANTHSALKIVALSVLNEVVDNQHGDEEDHGLEALEVQRHGLVHDPTEDDEPR
jgi:hypothetical protein